MNPYERQGDNDTAWQLSGNAESVDWSDIAIAGRAYADNIVGEPAVSKVMHMMADEIERLRAAVRPQPYAKSDERRGDYDTKRDATLTDAEREAVEWYAAYGAGDHAATLRGLLERLK